MTAPDHDLDLGIVLGSTNEDIWEAEMRRHDGLIVIRRIMADTVKAQKLDMTPRQRLQQNFAKVPIDTAKAALLNVIQELAPLVNASDAETDAVLEAGVERKKAEFIEANAHLLKSSPLLSALMDRI